MEKLPGCCGVLHGLGEQCDAVFNFFRRDGDETESQGVRLRVVGLDAWDSPAISALSQVLRLMRCRQPRSVRCLIGGRCHDAPPCGDRQGLVKRCNPLLERANDDSRNIEDQLPTGPIIRDNYFPALTS